MKTNQTHRWRGCGGDDDEMMMMVAVRDIVTVGVVGCGLGGGDGVEVLGGAKSVRSAWYRRIGYNRVTRIFFGFRTRKVRKKKFFPSTAGGVAGIRHVPGVAVKEGEMEEDVWIFDSGCSKHMTGNKSFLTDYQEVDGGFVAFAGSPKGGKIIGKGKTRTKKLDFEYVYFVKELKFNIFSVSQMCDKKNSVLLTETECLVLSPDFKLLDESQILLKNPDITTSYSFDLKKHCILLTPTTFWAEAVSTACYVQNRVLLTKPHNKTPYKLLHGRPPSISFMRPFGCHVTILNTLDPLGKFYEKADDGFFIGYSINSKAFRVFNTRTRKVEENLHINFLENKPNVAGNRPDWLFDIDLLTNYMNYEPVTAGNQTSKNACNNDNGTQQYILLPLLYNSSQSSKDAVADDAGKKTNEEPANEGERNGQEKERGAANKEDD
ncbi:retrovirus-related pol polyprotein from transposon TNT 1-94 [Tanacetum coccineum]